MRTLSIFIFALFVLTTVSAQSVVGDVFVRNKVLAQQEDSLRLELEIEVNALAMNACQSWTIVPVLCDKKGETLYSFPYVLVNGTNKARMYNRKMSFRNKELVSDEPFELITVGRKKHPYVFDYGISIPYEMWMDTTYLQLRQILTSCAGSQQYFTVEMNRQIDLEPYEPYVIQPQLAYRIPEREVKTRNVQGKAYLDFQVNRTEILPTYRRNTEELAKIRETVNLVRNDKNVEIKGLYIEGFASPDGPYLTNERLAQGRAHSLKEYIRTQFNLSDKLFKVSSVAEDWDGLTKLIEESDISHKDQILQIIETVDIFDGRESRLMQLAGGVPYRRMLNDMFPQLRRVEYQIDYVVRDYSVKETEEMLSSKPEQLSALEFYLLAENYGLGTEQGISTLETALRIHPTEEATINNAAVAMICTDQWNAARRYLEQLNETPEVLNNLGVVYLYLGELELAEKTFKRAEQSGAVQAVHNLEEVERKREDLQRLERYQR
ncbi:MAG: DUF3868 domain-containing protein [Bacteroides sp.]|nr:DUF3868 domain-containing protein [Bacteroides sp.]